MALRQRLLLWVGTAMPTDDTAVIALVTTVVTVMTVEVIPEVSGVCMILSLVVWSRKNVSNNIYIIIASSIPVPTECATVLVNSPGNAYTKLIIMDVIMSVLTSRVATVVVVASSEPSGELSLWSSKNKNGFH